MSQVRGGGDGLQLEEARVTVRFRTDGKREVRQSIRVRSEVSPLEGRIEHRIFLTDSETVSDLKVRSQQAEGNIYLENEGRGLETRFWVDFEQPLGSSISYDLSFEVETDDPARCPLAVPLAVPSDPHSPVRIQVELPLARVATGMSFPNLSLHDELWIGEMGGIPTFVYVPHGEPSSKTWWNRHGVDAFVLLLIAMSIAIWVRYREGWLEQ